MFNFSNRGVDFDLDPARISDDAVVALTPELIRLPLCRSRADQMHLVARQGARVGRFQPLAVPEADGCAVACPFEAQFESLVKVRLPGVGRVPCAQLRRAADAAALPEPEAYPLEDLSPEQIIQLAFNASIIDALDGQYLYEKLQAAREAPAAALIADAIDDQPYAALGTLLYRHFGDALKAGAHLAAKAAGTKHAAVALAGDGGDKTTDSPVSLLYAGTKYPAKALLRGPLMKTGGALVVGAAACVHLWRAAAHHLPQTTQFVSVVKGEGKIRLAEATIGADVTELLNACKIIVRGHVIADGIMSGQEIDPDSVVYGGLSSLAVLKKVDQPTPTPCISCGACNRVCPERLLPSYIIRALERGDLETAGELRIDACTGCGCCSYICPSGLPVGSNLQIGRELLQRQSAGAGSSGTGE